MMGLGSHLYGTTVQYRMSLGSMNMYAVLNQVLQHVPQHWQSVPADVAFTINCSDLVTPIAQRTRGGQMTFLIPRGRVQVRMLCPCCGWR